MDTVNVSKWMENEKVIYRFFLPMIEDNYIGNQQLSF